MATACPSSGPLTTAHTHSPDGVDAGGDDGSGGNREEGCGRPDSTGYISLSSSDWNSPPSPGVGVVAEVDEVPASNRSEEPRSNSPLHRKDGEQVGTENETHGAGVTRETADRIGPSRSPTQGPKPNPDATAAATAPLLTADGARTQAAEEVGAVGSREAEAMWKKARPRVRFFTHQVRLEFREGARAIFYTVADSAR